MNVPYDTLYKDQCFLTEQARENMRNHIADLPFNIKQAMDGLNKPKISINNTFTI
jgi:hypothetical protein